VKKLLVTALFVFFVSIDLFAIGFTYGPVANEQELIEQDGKFPVGFYEFPLFIGGIYHKINFSNRFFYYADLAFDIHQSRMLDISAGNNIFSYLLYFHNDINFFPFDQKRVYAEAGMELIVIDRIFSQELSQYTGSNFYISTNYFCYIDGGVNLSVGKIEIGFKMLYRLLPFSLDKNMGDGELTVLIGLQ
jgi:hypothetical protein